MKKRGLLFCSAFLIALTVAYADILQDTKSAEVSYTVAKTDKIDIEAKNIRFLISTGVSGTVKLRAEIIYTGRQTDKIRDFLDNFQEEIEDRITKGGGRLFIDGDLDEPFSTRVGNSRRVQYKDEDLRVTFTLVIPAENDFNLKNSYKDVTMKGNYTGKTNISLYSANFVGEVYNNLEMEMKFGEAEFQSAQTAEMKLYEQKLSVLKISALELESKFSKLDFNEIGTVDLDSYESKLELGELGGLKGQAKFGRISSTGTMKYLELDTYEVDMEFGEIEDANFTQSKFCEVRARKIGTLRLPNSYEDDFFIEELSALDVQSKFNNFEIDKLLTYAKVDGYETDLEINGVGREVERIAIDGKFNKLYLNSSNVPFEIKGDMQFGDVDFPADKVERKVYIKENSKLEIELVSKNGPPSLFIDLRGYEMKAEIQ